MGRRKKVSTNETSPDNSLGLNVNLQLDIKALKARNQQLAQALAAALQDKAQKSNEINALQAEFFDLNEKSARLESNLSSVGVYVKECLPMLNQLVFMFTKIIQLTSCRTGVTNLISTPNKDRRTQTVTPRTVNGHVLSHPTINLSRIVDINNVNNVQETDEQTSTNLQTNSALHVVIDRYDINDAINDQNSSPVERRNRYATNFNENLDTEISEDEDDAKSEDEDQELSDVEDEENPRLLTVPEEDEENLQTSDSNQSHCKEVRVCLRPLCPSQITNSLNTDSENGQTSRNSYYEADETLHVSQDGQNITDEPNNSKLISNTNESACSSYGSIRTDSDEEYESTIKKICLKRGNPFDGSDSLITFNASPVDLSKLSLIDNISSADASKSIDFNGMATDQSTLMNDLGLQPTTPRVTTSTPIVNTVRTRLSRKLKTSVSPVSAITIKRGNGEVRKLAHVALENYKMEKRLSGSPIKKIGDIVNDVSVRKLSDIGRIKQERSLNQPKSTSSSPRVENGDSSTSTSSKPNKEERLGTARNRKRLNSRGKENELKISLSKKSPRPKRSARPAELKEPNLVKKLRRSK